MATLSVLGLSNQVHMNSIEFIRVLLDSIEAHAVHAGVMIDPRSPLYAWEQARDVIRARIADGTYPDRLPAEVDLAHELGVARGTLRHALTALVDDGVLVSIRGRGYFVAQR